MPELHPENLKVIHTSERGAEVGRMAKGKSKPGTAFYRQKYCNQRCNQKNRCSFISMSATLPVDKYGRHPCYIKSQKKEVQEFFKNLFDNGEEGIINIIIELYSLLWIKTKQAPTTKELAEAITIGLEMKKGIYGDKQKIEHSGNLTQIIQAPELRRILIETEKDDGTDRDTIEA